MKNKINYKEKYEKLKALNIKYMVKEISITQFVEVLYEIEEEILKQAEKLVKRNGMKTIRTRY